MTDRSARMDLVAAAAFLSSVPRGRWTSYGDVAVAAGRSSLAAQGIVSWIGSKGHLLPNVHRVLNTNGEINSEWRPSGPGLPDSAHDVRSLLIAEGVDFEGPRAVPGCRWRPPNVAYAGSQTKGDGRPSAPTHMSRATEVASRESASGPRDLRDAKVAHVLARAVRDGDVEATDALRILRHELRRRNTGAKLTIVARSHAAQASIEKYAPNSPPANGSNDSLHADHVFPFTSALLQAVTTVDQWVGELARLRAVACVTASENYRLQVIERGGITGPEKYAVAGVTFTTAVEW